VIRLEDGRISSREEHVGVGHTAPPPGEAPT